MAAVVMVSWIARIAVGSVWLNAQIFFHISRFFAALIGASKRVKEERTTKAPAAKRVRVR